MNKNKNFNPKPILISLILIMSFGLFSIPTPETRAAGVAVVVSPSSRNVSTAGSISLTFTSTAAVPIGGTIQVSRPASGYSGTAALSVTAGTIGATSNTTLGSKFVATATATAQIPVGTFTITLSGLTSSATAANNAFEVYTSAGDYGANFQYVGAANVVTVRARVLSSLSFAIRNSSDTANTNICDMGDVDSSDVGFCDYRLKVATNAANGYTINVFTSGNFTNGGTSLGNAVAGAGGTGGTAQVAGTELYGALITKGSITGAGGTTTLGTAYNAGGSNNVSYNNITAATLLTATKPNSPATTDLINTTLVSHQAGVSSATPSGLYTQTVTYTISPSF